MLTVIAAHSVSGLVHLDNSGHLHLSLMKEPFERIAIDMVGPLPCSHKGYQYVLVICDYATRYPEVIGPLMLIE